MNTNSQQETIELYDPDTGVVKGYKVVNNEINTDTNFQKVWVNELIAILNALGGSKVKVFCYILKHKDLNNIFIGSTYDISNKLGISNNTVKQTLKIMKDLDYLRMPQNGVYHLNPNLIIKGKSKKRQIVLSKYNDIKSAA